MGVLQPHGGGCGLFRRTCISGFDRLRAPRNRVTQLEERAVNADPVPAIIFHSLDHAVAALTAVVRTGRAIVLMSAADAGGYLGPGWFVALVAAAREAVPEARFTALLDCGDNTGAALAAIRAEVEGVVFTGRADVALRLADIARPTGVRFLTQLPAEVLDLVEEFFASPQDLERRCAEFLGRASAAS